MGKLFGTDGVRGVANTELTCELALQIGRAAAAVLTDDTHKKPRVMIGKDTRLSSDMLESALAAGLCSAGADVLRIGVVPTPGVAFLVKEYGYDAGVMISASHNPCEFNGIKIFKGDGYKLSDDTENKIEEIIFDGSLLPETKNGDEVGTVKYSHKALDDYIAHVAGTTDVTFEGLKVAIDCANGSSSVSARRLFEGLGAECYIINCEPDGVNINKDCGSTHMEALSEYVVNNGMDIGLAFDGDADRFLAVDENGEVIDGDKIIAIVTKDLKDNGKLKDDTVVVTVMSNIGFFRFCENNGIKAEITAVGDRYVLENMLVNDYYIGGEQSGHIIMHEYATTGDGQLSAVQLLSVMKRKGKTLSKLATVMDKYPQVLENIKVSNEGKEKWNSDEKIAEAIENAEKELNGDGRVLVRASGTEPLVRVMIEGKEQSHINKLAKAVANVIKERIG